LKEREWKRVNGRLLELMSRSKKKEEEERRRRKNSFGLERFLTFCFSKFQKSFVLSTNF
jgi:hypothetical protein